MIQTEIKIGESAVLNALVEAIITTPSGQIKLKLFDTSKSEGIYKRYFRAAESGFHKIETFVNDNGMISYIQTGKGPFSNGLKQIGKNTR